MNKATKRAVEAAKAAVSRMTVPSGPEFERSICELAGQNVNTSELKREIDVLVQARAAELSSKLLGTFRMTLGL